MIKTVATLFLLIAAVPAFAQWSTHIEAENELRSSELQELPCHQGATGNKAVQLGSLAWVEYNANVPSDGIYKVSIRVAGTGANVFVTDTIWNAIGKVFIKGWTFSPRTDRSYATFTGHMFIKANNDKIRLQVRQSSLENKAALLVDWIEVAATNLLVCNNFDSDLEIFVGGHTQWQFATDSTLSLWESSPGFYGWIKQTARPESFRLTSGPTGTGNSAAIFTLSKSDTTTWPNVRAEIYKGHSPSQTLHIGFDFMCPTDIAGDGLPHTFLQFHGSGPLSPCISLRVENISGVPKYVMKVLWSAIPNPTTHQGEETYILADYVYGQWSKWAIKVKFAYDSTGQLQVYKDGVEVATRLNAPNCYNDGHYPYIKVGIYKWGWKGGYMAGGVWHQWAEFTPYETLTHLYDNLKIGDASSSIAEVSQND